MVKISMLQRSGLMNQYIAVFLLAMLATDVVASEE
jgi:hypothetical protein